MPWPASYQIGTGISRPWKSCILGNAASSLLRLYPRRTTSCGTYSSLRSASKVVSEEALMVFYSAPGDQAVPVPVDVVQPFVRCHLAGLLGLGSCGLGRGRGLYRGRRCWLPCVVGAEECLACLRV